MDKLEEVMPPAEQKEIKEQEIEEEAEKANGAAEKDDAEEEEEKEEAARKADAVEEEEEEEEAAAAGKDDAVDEEEEEEAAAAGKDDAVDEEEEEEAAAAAGKDNVADGEVKEDKEEADGNELGGGDKPKDKAIPQAAKKRAKKLPWQDKPKEKKPDECLNLNNEVVRMRKEVKRVRGLVIRKLTRQMAALKKRKGKELAVESNQRRAGRLLEEIHAMKTLPTDLVSKTALQRNLNFDQVCKNPRSTIFDRALARIATHRQFNEKIQDIKAAVKAFKEERVKGVKQVGKEKVQVKGVTVNLQSPEKNVERKKEEKGITVAQKEDKEEGDDLLKDITDAEPKKKTGRASPAVSQRKEMPEARNVRLVSVKGSDVNNVVKDKPQAKQAGKKPDLKSLPQVLQKMMDEEEESDLESDDVEEAEPQAKNQLDLKSEPAVLQKKRDEEEESDLESNDGEEGEPQSEKKPDVKSAPKVLEKKRDEEEESDLESDGVEKEYFDDSTEERFHKKSSQSEESDDDGFFVGKVRKFSKKKKKKNNDEEVTASEWREGTSSDKVQGELDELESRLKSKATSFQSVFCSSLSSSRPGGGRGRGGDGFRGRGRPNDGGGRDRDFSKPKFQKQERESFSSGGRGRGRGRGRGDGMRQNDRRAGGGSASTQNAPEQALHPSWEASKKRKEQQGQILAFQGKKIKFDIDD